MHYRNYEMGNLASRWLPMYMYIVHLMFFSMKNYHVVTLESTFPQKYKDLNLETDTNCFTLS